MYSLRCFLTRQTHVLDLRLLNAVYWAPVRSVTTCDRHCISATGQASTATQ